jgi:hypothetical protein
MAGAQTVSSRPLAAEPVTGGFLLARPSSFGQDVSERDPAKEAPSEKTASPGAATQDATSADSATAGTTAPRPVKTKNPTGALLRSLALPGWGQFYNEAYLKCGLVVAVEGMLVAGAIVEHQRAQDDHTIYEDLSQSDQVREAAWRRYSRRIDKRNSYVWYLAGAKFLSMIDAYVDAHLYRFDEGEFAVHIVPGMAEDLLVVLRWEMN